METYSITKNANLQDVKHIILTKALTHWWMQLPWPNDTIVFYQNQILSCIC